VTLLHVALDGTAGIWGLLEQRLWRPHAVLDSMVFDWPTPQKGTDNFVGTKSNQSNLLKGLKAITTNIG
jgi:hypothetical protein